MRLSRFAVLFVLPLVAAGAAMAYTMPGTVPYDGLISIDPGGMPIVPETMHVNVGIGYWSADKEFDADGNSVDIKENPNFIAVPLDIGYAFDENYMADITLQILRPSYTYTDEANNTETTYTTMGLGDLWVKVRGIWETSNDFYLGPRLAVKVPVGKVDYESTDPDLGDDQMDIDFAAVAGKYGGSTMFKFSGQLGFRYRMDKTISQPDPLNPEEMIETDVTPGMMIYTHLEPGIGTGSDQAFQIYLPIGYETTMANKSDGDTDENSETNALYVGLYPKYELDENNAIGLKFMYPLMGTNVPQAMYFTLTYGAFINL